MSCHGTAEAVIQEMTGSRPDGAVAIDRLCWRGGVSRAGYYRSWRAKAPREQDMAMRDLIQRTTLRDKRRHGYRYVYEALRAKGIVINHKRVLRLMREDNLLCLRKRPFVPVTTDSRHSWSVVPNRARGMQLSGLDQLWVADITYVRLREDFVYLAVILDAFSRRVVGWAIADHLQASLALDALNLALANRRPQPGTLVHHSDRGVQYACADYAHALEAHGVLASMSRVGNPYDNAKAESFMKTLKTEEVNGTAYRDLRHARRCIGAFIEHVYNRRRMHSSLAYRSPEAFEAAFRAQSASVATVPSMGFSRHEEISSDTA